MNKFNVFIGCFCIISSLFGQPEEILFSSGPYVPQEFQYLSSIAGGSGGIDVVKDEKGQKWAFKAWNNHSHGISELLAGLIINDERPLIVYRTPPKELLQQSRTWGVGTTYSLYALTPFIENGLTLSTNESVKLVSQYFVLCSLLSFWDIKAENLIFTEGHVHFIDMGGSFLYRALGEPKTSGADWSPHFVTELRTLRGPLSMPLAREAFKDLTDKDIDEQLRKIVEKAPFILQQANIFLKEVNLPRKEVILTMLARRLFHLSQLHYFFNHNFPEKAPMVLKALPRDAAGTLLWAPHGANSQPHLLVGKRQRHNWYGNLGGNAEDGEYLHTTAARETKEESGSLINIYPHQLVMLPSHDLVDYDQRSMAFSRYRTYLVETTYQDPKNFNDSEYTEYDWIAVTEVLKALEENHEIIEEGQKTIMVSGKYILHPPFFKSLQQQPIKNWLMNLVEKKAIPVEHTQGLVAQHCSRMNRAFKPVELDNWEDNLLDMSLNFKARTTPKTDDIPSMQQLNEGASHHMLKKLMYENNLNNLSDIEALKVLYNLNDENTAVRILSIIDKEKEFSNHYVLYHGLQFDTWFVYRVFSHLRHFFEGTPVQTNVLRSSEANFDELANAGALFDFIAGGNDNYSPGFCRAGVSCNLTLFGNLKNRTSSSIDYFLMGESSCPVDNKNLLASYFAHFGYNSLFEKFIKEIIFIMQAVSENRKTGVLLQIFIPKEHIAQAAYVCRSGGRIINKENSPIKNPTEIFMAFNAGMRVDDASTPHNEIQARLHAHLSAISNVKVFDYFNSPSISLSEIDEQIRTALDPYLVDLLVALSKQNEVYKLNPPLFQTVTQELLEIAVPKNQALRPGLPVISFDNILEIKKTLEKDEYFSQISQFLDSDTLRPVNANYYILQFVAKFSRETLECFVSKLRHLSIAEQELIMSESLRLPERSVDETLINVLAKNPRSVKDIIEIVSRLRPGQYELANKLLDRLPEESCGNGSEFWSLGGILSPQVNLANDFIEELLKLDGELLLAVLLVMNNFHNNPIILEQLKRLAMRFPIDGDRSYDVKDAFGLIELAYTSSPEQFVALIKILVDKLTDGRDIFSIIANDNVFTWRRKVGLIVERIKDYDESAIKLFFQQWPNVEL